MPDEEKKAIELLEELNWSYFDMSESASIPYLQARDTVLNLIEKQKAEIEKKDKQIDLMAEDKYENINMIQMANIGKEVNYDPIKLFSGIPDEEAIKIIKQYFEREVENGN